MSKGKRKYVGKSLDQVNRWVFAANCFVGSNLNARKAVQMFNKLSSVNVREIQKKPISTYLHMNTRSIHLL